MTSSLFKKYMNHLNKNLQGRRILIFLDRSPVHPPNLQLSNIEIVFTLQDNIPVAANGSGNYNIVQKYLQEEVVRVHLRIFKTKSVLSFEAGSYQHHGCNTMDSGFLEKRYFLYHR
jgi:hypothetical protein